MKKWYLAYCKPKEEARARAHLDAQGIESYYPMVEIEKLRRG
ncbi:MAG: transcription termination/antitermination NusG family protein, partial [Aeromonas veronii]